MRKVHIPKNGSRVHQSAGIWAFEVQIPHTMLNHSTQSVPVKQHCVRRRGGGGGGSFGKRAAFVIEQGATMKAWQSLYHVLLTRIVATKILRVTFSVCLRCTIYF